MIIQMIQKCTEINKYEQTIGTFSLLHAWLILHLPATCMYHVGDHICPHAPCESQAKPLPAPASYGLVLIGNIQQQHQRCDDNNNKTMSYFSQGTGASDGHPSPSRTLLASRISPWGVREQPWGLVEVEQIPEVDHRFPLGSSRLFSSPSSLSYERRTLWEELRR